MTVVLIFFLLVVLALEVKYAYTQDGFILHPECVLFIEILLFVCFLLKLPSKYIIRSSYIRLETPEFYC
jgi:hypothetical protein